MFVSTVRHQSDNQQIQSTYLNLDKSTHYYQPVLSPIIWVRDEYDMNNISSQDLATFLPKTLPCQEFKCLETTYNYGVSSPESGQSATKYKQLPTKQSRKRRRKQNNNNLSNSDSSDIECDDNFRPKKQRNIANDRERKRTQQLNEALSSLRRIVPSLPADKLSKYQTIKLATQYIEFLWTVLRKKDNSLEKQSEINFAFTEWRLKTELQRNNF